MQNELNDLLTKAKELLKEESNENFIRDLDKNIRDSKCGQWSYCFVNIY